VRHFLVTVPAFRLPVEAAHGRVPGAQRGAIAWARSKTAMRRCGPASGARFLLLRPGLFPLAAAVRARLAPYDRARKAVSRSTAPSPTACLSANLRGRAGRCFRSTGWPACPAFVLARKLLETLINLFTSPRHTGEGAPAGGGGGKAARRISENFRSEIGGHLACGFPPPALRATSPVRRGEANFEGGTHAASLHKAGPYRAS